jgi:hypothetical protein
MINKDNTRTYRIRSGVLRFMKEETMKNILAYLLFILVLTLSGLSVAFANTIQSYSHQTTPTGTDSLLVQEGASYVYENLTDVQGWLALQILNVNLTAGTQPSPPSNTLLEVANAASSNSRIVNIATAGVPYFTTARRDGTIGSPTTLQSGDEVGGYNAWGYNGSTLVGPTAAFRVYANQNWSVGANGSYADVATTPNGSATQAEVVRFENDGGVTIPSTVTGGDEGAGTVNAGGYYLNGTNIYTGTYGTAILGNPVVKLAQGNATVSQINAGQTILTGITGRVITITGYAVEAVGGTAATCTGIYLEDTNSSPVIVTAIAAANLTTSTLNVPGAAGNTLGAGFTYGISGLTSGKGLQIKVNGSNCTTMTSANYAITYTVQ